MKGSTRGWIVLPLVVIGLGLVALSFLEDEDDVRFVEDLLRSPQDQRGTVTLLAVPQPATIPVTGAQGHAMVENDAYSNVVVWTGAFAEGGLTYHSVYTLEALPVRDGWEFTFTNTTHVAGQPMAAQDSTTEFTVQRKAAVPLEAFHDGDDETPRIFALLDESDTKAMQPRPSQFEGRLLTVLPDGRPAPDGLLLFSVDSYRAGCSSKFLPPEEKERQARS